MNLLEKCVFNITQEIEDYGKERYDDGYKSAEIDLEEKFLEKYNEGYDACEEEWQDAEATEGELLKFAIDKIKDAQLRKLTSKQLLAELESDYCTHIPTLGLDKKQLKLI